MLVMALSFETSCHTCGRIIVSQAIDELEWCPTCKSIVKIPAMTAINEELRSHSAVDKIYQLGYSISHQFRSNGRFLDLQVRSQGLPAGHACFELRTQDRQVVAERLSVFDGHRRKGVANALYVVAKYLTGFEVVRATSQTDDGRAFWAQPNRPW